MSDTAANIPPAILAHDVWVRYLIRYKRADVTLRGTLVNVLERFKPGKNGNNQEFFALQGVSLEAHAGEVIGVVGRNGSGKTTLMKTLGGICAPNYGDVQLQGSVGCLLGLGVGFNNNLTGRENIFLNASILGISRKLIVERCEDIISFAELEDFIDAPVKTYSSGMRSRLGFSIATHLDPDILLLDEALSTGDAFFREKAGSILDRFSERNKLVIIASHNMDLISSACTRAIWLEDGQILMEGSPQTITKAYLSQATTRI